MYVEADGKGAPSMNWLALVVSIRHNFLSPHMMDKDVAPFK